MESAPSLEQLSQQNSHNKIEEISNKPLKHSQELSDFIGLVPKHLRKYIKHGAFVIPNSALIDNYFERKEQLLEVIRQTKKASVNSMHKYTSANPFNEADIETINERISKNLNTYYELYLKQFEFKTETKLFAAFSITYNEGHKALALHTDDSTYTVNFCLKNSAKGNEVVFNQMFGIEPVEDYALIHSGKLRHHTNDLIEGERTNVVLWYK